MKKLAVLMLTLAFALSGVALLAPINSQGDDKKDAKAGTSAPATTPATNDKKAVADDKKAVADDKKALADDKKKADDDKKKAADDKKKAEADKKKAADDKKKAEADKKKAAEDAKKKGKDEKVAKKDEKKDEKKEGEKKEDEVQKVEPKNKLILLFIFIDTIIVVSNIGLFVYHKVIENEPMTSNELLGKLAAVLLFAFGFMMRTWSISTLGKHFTYQLAILKKHELVKSGPYRLLLHPSYTGLLMIQCSLYLYYQAFFYVWVAALCEVVVYAHRINLEEQWLSEKFGEEWKNYVKTRYRLIPYVF